MSQVAKSASAFVRAFLAMLALELEDMVVPFVRRENSLAFMAIVSVFRFDTFRISGVVRLMSEMPGHRLGIQGQPTVMHKVPFEYLDPRFASQARHEIGCAATLQSDTCRCNICASDLSGGRAEAASCAWRKARFPHHPDDHPGVQRRLSETGE